MPPIRVLVADDDAKVLSALVDTLRSDERFAVVGTASSGTQACRLTEALHPDVVLLDVRMPGGGAAAVAVIQLLPDPPAVIAVSAEVGVKTVVDLVTAGAVGYLPKSGIGSALPELVARCAGGEVVLAVPTAAMALRIVVTGGASG